MRFEYHLKDKELLSIDFTNEMICGESGPNFYWYGSMEDFYWLTSIMHPLGKINNYQMRLPCKKDELDVFVELSSRTNSKILNKYDNSLNCIRVELDREIWREILKKFFLLSMVSGREYIELEDFDLYEEANFIIDSQRLGD